MKILAIIPAYNEALNIKNTIEKLKIDAPQIDYVIINDCSKDTTLTILEENSFNYINLPVNLGIGGGVQTGYKYGVENGYDIIIQQDGDGRMEVFHSQREERKDRGKHNR